VWDSGTVTEEVTMGLHVGQSILTVEEIRHAPFIVGEAEHGHHQRGGRPEEGAVIIWLLLFILITIL